MKPTNPVRARRRPVHRLPPPGALPLFAGATFSAPGITSVQADAAKVAAALKTLLPADATATQRDAVAKHSAKLSTLRVRILECVQARRAFIPSSIAADLQADIVSVRAACTTLHQAGLLRRTAQVLGGELAYVDPKQWKPHMGEELPRHHGRRR